MDTSLLSSLLPLLLGGGGDAGLGAQNGQGVQSTIWQRMWMGCELDWQTCGHTICPGPYSTHA